MKLLRNHICDMFVLRKAPKQYIFQGKTGDCNEVKKRFWDSYRVFVRAGAGGQGFPKFGGIGGKGGDIIVKAQENIGFIDLKDINPTKRYTAASGSNSSKRLLIGAEGEDQIIPVPVGVCVKNDEGRIIGDLNEDGQEVIVAYGGQGGGPETSFNGIKGEALSVKFDLKLIADIGLVGFPNAGKSTFLSVISRAKPKIASYPFTTIRPQIGVMEYPDFRKITVADLPGLIEGAHVNFGMGHKFLKHVERTKMLLFMVDINGFRLSADYPKRNAFETILLLNKELELYDKSLLDKPVVLALNKIDTHKDTRRTDKIVDLVRNLPDSLDKVPSEFHPQQLIKFSEIHKVSTKYDINTDIMKTRLREILDAYALKEEDRLRLDSPEFTAIEQHGRILGHEQNKHRLA